MTKPRAAIVGSGFGGLAAAIRLQAAGMETVIFEKRDLAGGRAYVYRDQGFTFDAGPTVITAPGCLRELFTIAGRELDDYVELLPVKPFYRLFWEDGYRFDYSDDGEAIEKQIIAKAPGDLPGYKKFLAYSEEVFREGYEKLAHVPFLNWRSMIAVAPQLIRLEAYRSVYSAVAKHIQDPHLRQLFSFHSLLVGGNPFTTTSIYTLIHCLERKWGVYFPKGGTGALVQSLVKLYDEMGGKIHYQSEVAEILTENEKVIGLRTQDGAREQFDVVVSNADVVHTYDRLLKHAPEIGAMRHKLKRMAHSMSLFLIYFGVRQNYPDLLHHNIIFGPRYRELLEDVFLGGRLASDFSLYLHAPSKSDPGLAPPGCETYYVLSPVPHLGKLAIDWRIEGPRYAERILKYLEERYMPGLRDAIVTQRIFTPKDFETELNAFNGSAFSLEPRLTQSAYFRVHNRDRIIKGLYFVGAGTHPGAGIPGVVNSGKATAGLILQDYKSPLTRARQKVAEPSYA
ncbi:MAG: phytoene desaturase [Deltaproteobacteria bacterium]|nr:phytoene desaturase [Deltaproteobacteria bacterium]